MAKLVGCRADIRRGRVAAFVAGQYGAELD